MPPTPRAAGAARRNGTRTGLGTVAHALRLSDVKRATSGKTKQTRKRNQNTVKPSDCLMVLNAKRATSGGIPHRRGPPRGPLLRSIRSPAPSPCSPGGPCPTRPDRRPAKMILGRFERLFLLQRSPEEALIDGESAGTSSVPGRTSDLQA